MNQPCCWRAVYILCLQKNCHRLSITISIFSLPHHCTMCWSSGPSVCECTLHITSSSIQAFWGSHSPSFLIYADVPIHNFLSPSLNSDLISNVSKTLRGFLKIICQSLQLTGQVSSSERSEDTLIFMKWYYFIRFFSFHSKQSAPLLNPRPAPRHLTGQVSAAQGWRRREERLCGTQ